MLDEEQSFNNFCSDMVSICSTITPEFLRKHCRMKTCFSILILKLHYWVMHTFGLDWLHHVLVYWWGNMTQGLHVLHCSTEGSDMLYRAECFSILAELQDALEEVLPTLREQGISVYLLSEACSVQGIKTLSDKISQASDQPLSRDLRANVNIRSTALYIYTSGTTGTPGNWNWNWQSESLHS